MTVREIIEEIVIDQRAFWIENSPRFIAENGIDGTCDMTDEDLYEELRLNDVPNGLIREKLKKNGIDEDMIKCIIVDIYGET